MNHMLHIAATTQIRLDTAGRAYYRHKIAAGKTRMEAMRCLKRRISNAVFRQLLADARADANRPVGAGPGGHCGASQESSAVDLPPHIDTSDQPLPGPAHPTLPGTKPHANPCAASAPRPSRRRAGAVKVERPTGRTTLTATSAGATRRRRNRPLDNRGGAGMTQPTRPFHPARDEAAPSDPKRSLDVARVAATHFACCREVAAEVGADSRDGRSGGGEPNSGATPAPLTGNPGRRVDANR
jgi:hypothetical protein